jgi:hypothetical protein
VSDSFLIASILDCLGLFITDALTYRWGGMSEDDIEIPIDQLQALKKVSYHLRPTKLKRELTSKQVQFAGNVFYDTGIYWPKLAVLALYYRLFPPTMPWLRKVLYAVMVFTGCAMATTFFLDTFWCGRQVSVQWSTEEGACNSFSSKEVFRIDWCMNILTDILSKLHPPHPNSSGC